MEITTKILKSVLFLLIGGTINGFTDESTAYVIKIVSYPDRQDAVQIFLDKDGDFLEEKRLDLFGEYVQQVLKDHIKENVGIVYENEDLQSFYFTSSRLLAIILPDGNHINVLDLFPQFNDTTLNFCFPYAFAKRQREQKETAAGEGRGLCPPGTRTEGSPGEGGRYAFGVSDRLGKKFPVGRRTLRQGGRLCLRL